MVAQPQPDPDLLPHSKYTLALERQIETLHLMRTRKPFNAVARHVTREEGRPFKDDYTLDLAVAEALERAVPYFWSTEMAVLLSPDAPADALVEAPSLLLPDAYGYVWFESPMQIAADDPEVVRAVLWEPVDRHGNTGTMVTCFTGYPEGENLGLAFLNVATGTPRTPLHWRVGDTLEQWLEQIDLQYADAAFRRSVRAVAGMPADQHRRQLRAFGILFARMLDVLNQRLTRIASAPADRPTRRRAQAVLGKPDLPMTRVVLLRPIDYVATGEPSEPGDPVAWTHRWEVREHTRWQRYGPGNALVKQITIRAHVKGPANLPLITPAVIKGVVR